MTKSFEEHLHDLLDKQEAELSTLRAERDALKATSDALLSAINYRFATLVAGATKEKQLFADERFWDAVDAVRAALKGE